MKLTVRQLEAIANLRGNPNFDVFQEVVREHQSELVTRLTQATDTATIFRSQGGISALERMLEAYAEAPETIRKIKGR